MLLSCSESLKRRKMADAYVETTILTDILLKPESLKNKRAKAALGRYANSLLPMYSIKEWKAGPLKHFAYIHDKLLLTRSFSRTMNAVSALSNRTYAKSTQLEALAAASITIKNKPQKYMGLGNRDDEMADSYRLALASIILRSWWKRRKITTAIVDELSCYFETEPQIAEDGTFDLRPQLCDSAQECSLAARLRSQPKSLAALRDAIPENSKRPEDNRRRKALKHLIKHPGDKVTGETCRDLGDAIFAFFCPQDAVILTTNIDDHLRLARALGKNAEKP
jgi:hypothetical protein